MASEDNTIVEVSNRVSTVLEAGQSEMFIIDSDEYVSIRADKPILLSQVCFMICAVTLP